MQKKKKDPETEIQSKQLNENFS